MFVLQRPDGNLLIEELGDNLRKLTAVPSSPNPYSSRTSCTTTYPLDLIDLFLNSTGVAGVCEVIGRDSDPESIATNMQN